VVPPHIPNSYYTNLYRNNIVVGIGGFHIFLLLIN